MRHAIAAAVQESGRLLPAAHRISDTVIAKQGTGNFVTAYDLQVQQLLRERLLALLPDAHFVGEEDDCREDPLHGLAFIVDPIDCTANFIRGLKHSAVSVALACEGRLVISAVYNPYRDELFTAETGHGAFLNDRPIQVSDRPLSEGVFCFGTSPYDASLRTRSMTIASRLMAQMQDLRRFGSAALDLCDVACGRVELGFECILQPWDYAGGALLVQEAGGQVTQLDGSPITLDRPCSILSGNARAHAAFLAQDLGR